MPLEIVPRLFLKRWLTENHYGFESNETADEIALRGLGC